MSGKRDKAVPKKSEKQAGAKNRQVTFGSVTVRTRPAEPQLIRQNIVSGQSALERARDPLLKAGIQLKRRKSVPLYHVDPNKPDELIRRLDGKLERGTFVDGVFQVKP